MTFPQVVDGGGEVHIWNKVRIGKNLSGAFPVQNELGQEILMANPFQLCFRI
jgi:hypothetical protein